MGDKGEGVQKSQKMGDFICERELNFFRLMNIALNINNKHDGNCAAAHQF